MGCPPQCGKRYIAQKTRTAKNATRLQPVIDFFGFTANKFREISPSALDHPPFTSSVTTGKSPDEAKNFNEPHQDK
jgi:hypothetical protein